MSLATSKRIPIKPEKRIFTRPPNPPSKQPVTPRYLHTKKTNSNKVSGPTANATPFQALKRRPLKKDAPEISKNEAKKSSDDKHSFKPENISVVSSMNEMHSFKVISDISEISSPGIQSNKGKLVTKYAADQYEKFSPQNYSNPYNPNQFSSKVQQVKQKPTENKKLVEEIQKNLKKWRIQRDTKAKENVNSHLNVTNDKTSLICTDVNKFIPEEKTNDNRTKVNDKSNVDDNKSISRSHDISVQVSLNGDNHKSSNASIQTKALIYENKSKDCNNKTENLNENTNENDSNNQSNLNDEKIKPSNSDLKATSDEISNFGSDKKTKKKNDVHNILHSGEESEVIIDSIMQSGDVPEDSMTENHKKCLYALVDSYLTKTKTNTNKSMENFMKYMLNNLGPNNTEEKIPASVSLDNVIHEQTDTEEPENSIAHNTGDIKQDLCKNEDRNSEENSHPRKIKSKEKYLKKLSTEKFKSKFLEDSHSKEADRMFVANSDSTVQRVAKENPLLSKKDKFKQLTLISSKQNENMCIHINYQSHTGPLGKSKLTIHKESHIDIRPQLTKHTFTTATCMPRVHSSKPNISTHYLVHLNEGGCKEIDPDSEELTQDSFSFPNTGILSYKKNRLDNIIRALIRHIKMNMRLGNKMTSTVAEKLLALQEYLCKYYSNQPGGSLDFNSLSSHSKQIITLIILEIDNPQRPNLDVRTNQNLKLILQQIMESIQGPPHSHPPPPLVSLVGKTEPTNCSQNTETSTYHKPSVKNVSHSRISFHRPTETNNDNTDIPCLSVPTVPSSKAVSNHLPRRIMRKSFGMHKNYLSKKIRQSLDRKLSKLTENKLNSFVARWEKSLNIHERTKQLETSRFTDDLKQDSPDSEPIASDEVIYESDWVTPSSTSSDQATYSNSKLNETPDKAVQIIEKTNHAEIQIRFQDKDQASNKEHYRISVRTDEDSVIRGVRPQLPCTMLEDNIRNRYVLTMKETQYNNVTYDVDSMKQYQVQENAENNLVLALDLETSGNNMKNIYSKLDNVIADKKAKDCMSSKCTVKNRSNLTNVPLQGPSSHESFQDVTTDTIINENDCGDSYTSNSHSKHVDRNIPHLKRGVKGVSLEADRNYVTSSVASSQTKTESRAGKTTVGVNTDASLLDSLIKNLQPTDTEDSYACDLSMCFSTDNELSEGEIGFFAFRSQSSRICHAKNQFSQCKSPLNNSDCSSGGGNMRKSRMLELQQFTDIFLTN